MQKADPLAGYDPPGEGFPTDFESMKTPLLPPRPEIQRTQRIIKGAIGVLTSGAVAGGATLADSIGWKAILEGTMQYGFGPVIACLSLWWLFSVVLPRQEQLLQAERDRADAREAAQMRRCEEERKKDRDANQLVFDKLIGRIERVDDSLGVFAQEMRHLGEEIQRGRMPAHRAPAPSARLTVVKPPEEG